MSRMIAALLVSASFCIAQSVPEGVVKAEGDYDWRHKTEEAYAAQLQQDPSNLQLLLKLGRMKMDDSALDEAQTCFERASAIDPANTTALYGLGVLGWTRVFAELRTARAQLAMDPESPGPLRDRSARAVLSGKYSRVIDDSIAYFQRVLAIDPQHNDSMAYLNLVYRSKADLEDTAAAYREDIAIADEWVHKALETAKAKQQAGTLNPAVALSAPPPPPPVAAPTTPARIRVGGNVQAANLIRKVDPLYPALAEQARIQGVVRFNAVIGKDGTILNLTVVSGHPMLVQSALDAVKSWLYKPILLNGEPVEVITTVEVPFNLP